MWCVSLEAIAYLILRDPEAVSIYAIVINIGLIIYTAFRWSIPGGFTASIVTIGYYLYIIWSRGYAEPRLSTSLYTTAILAVLYFIIALTIGWLKQTIDKLLSRERVKKQELQDLVKEMQELERRKDDFVNMASHELKTPITSLNLYIDVLEKRIGSKKYKGAGEALERIKKQTKNLEYIISNLLDVSRIQTGKVSYKKENFRLDELVSEAVVAFYDGNKKQKIKILKNPKIIVKADRNRIYQVLANLISNAVKYSYEKGDINISVRKEGKKAIVSVQDFGIGIKKDNQRKIFTKLYQVSEDHAGTYPGFGMGLFISEDIIKRHRGNIWVESEEGKGSTFYFSLPIS